MKKQLLFTIFLHLFIFQIGFSQSTIAEKTRGMVKHTGFFDFAFEQVGHPNKEGVLMIGDSLSSDILGGHNYGLNTCWYNPKR